MQLSSCDSVNASAVDMLAVTPAAESAAPDCIVVEDAFVPELQHCHSLPHRAQPAFPENAWQCLALLTRFMSSLRTCFLHIGRKCDQK